MPARPTVATSEKGLFNEHLFSKKMYQGYIVSIQKNRKGRKGREKGEKGEKQGKGGGNGGNRGKRENQGIRCLIHNYQKLIYCPPKCSLEGCDPAL